MPRVPIKKPYHDLIPVNTFVSVSVKVVSADRTMDSTIKLAQFCSIAWQKLTLNPRGYSTLSNMITL